MNVCRGKFTIETNVFGGPVKPFDHSQKVSDETEVLVGTWSLCIKQCTHIFHGVRQVTYPLNRRSVYMVYVQTLKAKRPSDVTCGWRQDGSKRPLSFRGWHSMTRLPFQTFKTQFHRSHIKRYLLFTITFGTFRHLCYFYTGLTSAQNSIFPP